MKQERKRAKTDETSANGATADNGVDRSGPILRGRRMFVELKAIGEVDDRDRAVLSMGFKGKLIAEPDRPMDLVIGLLGEVSRMARYSGRAALVADLGRLLECVAVLQRRIPEEESPERPAEICT